MSKSRAKKMLPVPKKRVSEDWLQKAVAKLTKAELVEIVIETARADSGLKRRLEMRFPTELSDQDLIHETARAISDATDFDEREINRNFSYDYDAYAVV